MYKYAQIKSFCHELKIQVYMYDFIYIDPEKILEENYLQSTNFL